MRQTGRYYWSPSEGFDREHLYEMFACPVCHEVTLRERYTDEIMMDYNDDGIMIQTYRKTILYPTNSMNHDSIPLNVKEAFGSALKTKSIDKNVCLMALRRTLELILKDKGATKWGLKDKIEEIADKGLLPETLKEASSLTKILGDSAAHGKELEIDQDDIDNMVKFIEFIIEYLYIIPYKIGTCKQKLSSRLG